MRGRVRCLTLFGILALAPGAPPRADTADELVKQRQAELKAYPNSANVAAAYCDALARAGRWAEALTLANRVLASPGLTNSWATSVWLSAGHAWLAQRNWDAADECFRRSMLTATADDSGSVAEARVQRTGIGGWRRWREVDSAYLVLLFSTWTGAMSAGQQGLFAYRADLAYVASARALGATLNTPPMYFAYSSIDELQHLTGMPTSFADSERYRVHAAGFAPSAQQITQVLARHSVPGIVQTAAFSEGLAHYLGWQEEHVHDQVAEVIRPTDLRALLEVRGTRELAQLRDGVALSASLVGYILETYPMTTAKAFLEGCAEDPADAAQQRLRCSLEELAQAWVDHVKRSAELRKTVREAELLDSTPAEGELRKAHVQDTQRLDAALYLGQNLLDKQLWQEAAEPLDRAATLVGLRGWSYRSIAQLASDRAYVLAQLERWDAARESASLAERIGGEPSLTAWAAAAQTALKKRRLPETAPPRIVGRSWAADAPKE